MGTKDLDLSFVYDDDDLVVVDKPAGLLSVPVPPGRVTNLFHLIENRFPQARIGSVHRIDRYTSGLVVFSKNEKAHRHLLDQFSRHTPRRRYLAVVRGVIEQDCGELGHHLKLIKEGFRNVVVAPDEPGATPARLTYQVKECFADTTLVQVQLDTGLKNQIRVQFNAAGHQLVGDQHYAPDEETEPLIGRQALHAAGLSFIHPRTQEEMSFEAPLPADMLKLVDHYRWLGEIR